MSIETHFSNRSQLVSNIDNVLVDLKNNNDYNATTADAASILDLVDDLEKLYK